VTEPLDALEERLGHRFRDRALLLRALTHSSFANEADPAAGVADNETLEFLGDSVLGFLVADLLFRAHPEWGQGWLTKARAELVSEGAFADKGRNLGLGTLLRLARTDERAGGRERDARLADAFEALVAAVYLDAGLDVARAVVERLFSADLVSETAFAEKGRALGLGALLRLAPTDERAGGRDRDARLADAFEAVVAALYLDGGLGVARAAVERLFSEDLAALDPAELSRRDAKSALQERAQAEGKPLPRYRLLSESGPDHEKRFAYEVRYGEGDELTATGEGPTKKEAQREAARAALDLLSARDA